MFASKQPLMEYSDLIKEIDSGKFKPVYLLMGEEPYYNDIIIEHLIDKALQPHERDFNQMIVYGSDTNAAEIASMARRYPVFAPRQLIIVKEAQSLDQSKVGKYTVGEWMEVWFEDYAKIKVRPSSHQTYRGYIDNHIKPNIGKIPLGKLSPLDLQKFYKKLLSSGRVERIESRKQSKGLSPKTVRNFHQIIASAMELAREQKRSSPTRLKAAYCSRSSTKR